MKNLSINIKVAKKKITLTKDNSKLQVSINGKTKAFSKEELNNYRKSAERTYPKVQDDIDSIEVNRVCICSDIVGVISDIFVEKGQYVKKDDLLLSISAMKVENEISSLITGKVSMIYIKKNQKVEEKHKLILIKK